MGLQIELFYLFLFSAVSLIAVGVLGKKESAVFVALGGFMFLLLSFSMIIDGGVSYYNTSLNVTETFNATSNVTTIAQTPNYNTKNDLQTGGLATLFLLTGIACFWYGVDIYQREVKA